MSQTTWSEREVELACKRENPDWDEKSFDYGCACYQSALKAYKSSCADGHSFASFGFTRNILERLLYNLPLSPITEKDFEDVGIVSRNDEKHYTTIQCPRMSSLFMDKYDDGTVKYHDNDRVTCVNIKNDSCWHCGLLTQIVNEKYPITLPYYPGKTPYKLYFEEFLVDPANGDFDTQAALYIITPDCERVEINRYWTEKNKKMVEIGKEEYEQLKQIAENRRHEK